MLARPRVRSSIVLLVLLLIGVAVVGALTAGAARDLLHRDTARSGPIAATYLWAPKPEDMSTSSTTYTIRAIGDAGTRPVAWLLWTSLPGALVLLTLLALMVGIVLSARRHGRYATRTLRLIRAAGLVGLFGGLAAAGIEALADRWTTPLGSSGTASVAPWQLAALLGLLGCALLAVREALAQAGELHAELETVI